MILATFSVKNVSFYIYKIVLFHCEIFKTRFEESSDENLMSMFHEAYNDHYFLLDKTVNASQCELITEDGKLRQGVNILPQNGMNRKWRKKFVNLNSWRNLNCQISHFIYYLLVKTPIFLSKF